MKCIQQFYIVLMTSELWHNLQIPTEATLTHRVSVAILEIDVCPVGHQQVDDLAVAIPGCQHQAGDLLPRKRTRDKKEGKKERGKVKR